MTMFDCRTLFTHPRVQDGLAVWMQILPEQLEQALSRQRHGHLALWQSMIDALPGVDAVEVELNAAAVTFRSDESQSVSLRDELETVLKALHPWRKGPFDLFGIEIDTEWRSDMKWQRVAEHIDDLAGRLVLDVGSGNGYYGWRMLGAGAEMVVGIDPMLLFNVQFQLFKHYFPDAPIHVLPLGMDDVPKNLRAFDTVFSMGVLYHRRSPIDHLLELKGCLRAGGQLVLETLVVEGGREQVLVPDGRYAKMRNVWFIPSCDALQLWLERCGFRDVNIVDVTNTTVVEQRSTPWMEFESLADFLDPDDSSLTIEGHPAPRRALILARVP